MVAPHAEDRFYGPDWYFGKYSTDITKRFGKQIPSHSYHPEIKNAPTPYHVLPYHDMSDKFRNRFRKDRRSKAPKVDSYHGRITTEITSPTKFAQEENETPFIPWPKTSNRIGDMAFSRYEYLHPLGRPKPNPMEDYVPILRDRRTGKVIGNPSPPPSRKESRRRMLGLPPDGCHSPGSPCNSGSSSYRGGGGANDEEEDDGDDLGHSRRDRRRRHHDEYEHDPKPQAPSKPISLPNDEHDAACDDPNYRPYSAPAPSPTEAPEPPRPRRRKSYLSSSFSSNAQPVGGRPQRTHADEMEDRMCNNDQPDSQYSASSYVTCHHQRQEQQSPAEGQVSRPRYSLGSMSRHAQPVGGRASIINMMEMGQIPQPQSKYTEELTPYRAPARNYGSKVYPPQHHFSSQEPSHRYKDDEAFTHHKFESHQDDRSNYLSHSIKRPSLPPKYDSNLPPESERGRSHRRSADRSPVYDPNLPPESERGRSHRRSADRSPIYDPNLPPESERGRSHRRSADRSPIYDPNLPPESDRGISHRKSGDPSASRRSG